MQPDRRLCFCFMQGSFHQILGIQPVKAFRGYYLWHFGHKIEFSFNHDKFFLLNKQNQYAQKFSCISCLIKTHKFLRSFQRIRECTTTELQFFIMYNHLS